MSSGEDAVFNLLTELCSKTAVKFSYNKNISQKKLASKMRSRSYEIILKKSAEDIPESTRDPISDMLCYYFVNNQNTKNVGEYQRMVELRNVISTLRSTDFKDRQDHINSVLKFLVSLSDSVKEDLSSKLYQSPFSFGAFDNMLPKPPTQPFGSPQPYSYYPPHVFELPYSMRCQANNLERDKSQTYTEYTVQTFESKFFMGDMNLLKPQSSDVKTCLSPMSLVSLTSTHLSPYSDTIFNYPRLTAPRDLKIPGSSDVNVKVSFESVTTKSEIHEVYRAGDDEGTVDIWELAMQVDKDIPHDIWEYVAKLPPINERQLIASSPREMRLWRLLHEDVMSELHVVSEKQFIRHVMYLIIGIETSSFPFNEEWNCFTMRENLVLEAISRDKLKGYVSELLTVGTYYRRLYRFAFNQIADEQFHTKGLVYEAAREVIRRYLLEFRLLATEIYEQCNKSPVDGANCIPTLLHILHNVEGRKYEIETIASIYKLADAETNSLPQGAELMSYFFNEIYLVTHKKTAFTMFNSLFALCRVYFKFIERFIFEGELDDNFNEFFIRKDSQYINCHSKRYWDKGFHITQSVAIPDFLRALAKCILLCGKSLRLLKMCNPNDPLLLLISSDHPSISCCVSFPALSRQQRLLDVYRTRCLFVSGEPASFQQIMLKREAERKAFTEMAALKQAETMDKIVAERKRLAQLIIAEKQHSLRVLEAAMAETKAAKSRSRRREKIRSDLEKEADATGDQIDAKIRDDEKNKLMEYYSKLNIEVEKSKIHTEWKIKRLQLDESRIQLLSTEERNLKREKLELEHQRNEECMAMSIQSIDHGDENDDKESDQVISEEVIKVTDLNEKGDSTKAVESHNVFSAICNAAKSIFGVSKADDNCDNKRKLDSQGNVVEVKQSTSSSVIGRDLNEVYDNMEFLKMRQEAIVNKQKVMAHEFGQTDNENNQMKDPSLTSVVDEENNMQNWTPFDESRRNKLKVLGAGFGIKAPEVIKAEPKTDAQKEALINKLKVLGVEYNLPPEVVIRNDPANVAQEEALINKQKVLGAEYNLPPEIVIRNDPANVAQEEALINKRKVLGAEFYLPPEVNIRNDPANEAQQEAVKNKQKVLGAEYNMPPEIVIRNDPANVAQEEALINKRKVLGAEFYLPPEIVIRNDPANEAQHEAVKNKHKVLGTEFYLPPEIVIRNDPANVAQEEAVKNKQKVLGAEYNLPPEKVIRNDPANEAQHEAVKNKQKVLGAEFNLPHEIVIRNDPANVAQEEAVKNKKKGLGSESTGLGNGENVSRRDVKKNLTLNLKPYGESSSQSFLTTPNTGAVTPGELFPRLDLETPTTAEINLEGPMTSEVFTPRSETKDIESIKTIDKDYISSDGFAFPIIDDETESASDAQILSPENSPSKTIEAAFRRQLSKNFSVFDILDSSYNLADFDPFGVKELDKFTKDYFNKRMDAEMAYSCYTHPAVTMEEVKKSPYTNIFAHFGPEEKEDKVTCDNIATLTACLQRSVMLPLTYQLEVVNNSILTYFLVNLDMYEHLRCLKDYFFLMDGEFSRSICHNLFSKLSKTLNPHELLNFATLHNILDKALGSSISHQHKFSGRLSFALAETPLSLQHSSPDALAALALSYSVRWPLNIILSQEALLRYQRVFQFLLKMRRVFWLLSEHFQILKQTAKKNSRKLLRSPQYRSIQIYRHIMASMIRALDNYIVTSCILSSWVEFENDLKKARTLDDLYDCHVVYIKKVLFRCLLNNRSTPVMKLLNDIFTVILKFSRVLKAGEWQQKEPNGYFTHPSFVQLKELFHLFEKLAKVVHKVVTRLMECGYQRHLAELLTMVNLNGYYDPDKTKEEHSTSVKDTSLNVSGI